MNRLFKRSWISPVVAVTFITVAITGFMIFFRFRSYTINSLHEWSGIAFALAGIVHLMINWKAFLSCFKKPSGIAALIICALLCLGFIWSKNLESRRASTFSPKGGCGFGAR